MTMVFINSRGKDFSIESLQIKNFLPEAYGLVNLKTNEEINLNSIDNFLINKMTAEIFLIRK